MIEYRIYTINEALKAIEEGDPTMLIALFEGIVVYNDGSYIKLKNLFKKLWRIEVLKPGTIYKFIRISY